MITFNHVETDMKLVGKRDLSKWIKECIAKEKMTVGEINYIFCDDEYLLKINQKYLNHDTYTDIITFDYTEESEVSGDIYISIDRVEENADSFSVPFLDELHRVMIHGIMHLCGYKDKSKEEATAMRKKEDSCLSIRTF